MSENIDYQSLYENEQNLRKASQEMLSLRTRQLTASLDTLQQQYQALYNQKRGLELLLSLTQIGECQLNHAEALKLYLDAISQLFEGYYGLLFQKHETAKDLFQATGVNYFDDDYSFDDSPFMLSDKRMIDLRDPLFSSVARNACTISIKDLSADLQHSLGEAGFQFVVYIPIKLKNEIFAVCEVPVRTWSAKSDAYLAQATLASMQLTIMLERNAAKHTIQSSYIALHEAYSQLNNAQANYCLQTPSKKRIGTIPDLQE